MPGLSNLRSRYRNIEVDEHLCNYLFVISHFIFPLFQIEKLQKDIEMQRSQRTEIESRANDAEKKVEELTVKLNAVSA